VRHTCVSQSGTCNLRGNAFCGVRILYDLGQVCSHVLHVTRLRSSGRLWISITLYFYLYPHPPTLQPSSFFDLTFAIRLICNLVSSIHSTLQFPDKTVCQSLPSLSVKGFPRPQEQLTQFSLLYSGKRKLPNINGSALNATKHNRGGRSRRTST
jgi:hypothetical protein